MNHARRLADGDWAGPDSDEDVEEKLKQQNEDEDEGMEIEQRKKLPRHYANQVCSTFCFMYTIIDLNTLNG